MDRQGTECPKCAELMRHIEWLERRVSTVLSKLNAANQRINRLQQALSGRNKDSTNSSKPPSSDIVKPPKTTTPSPRRRGAQANHAPQRRPPFESGEIDAIERHTHEACPQCGGPVEQLPMPARVVQQAELVRKPTLVVEHRSCTCRCPACRQDFTRPIPPQIAAAGTFGPRLTAWVAYLKGACHASYGTIQQLLRETCGLRISTGALNQLCQKVSRSLGPCYDDLRAQIPQQKQLHVDETGHRENGRRHWTWVFRAALFTLFHIAPTRSESVLEEVLGNEFAGTLVSDYYSAYRLYLKLHPRADAQYCLAHLIRDVKFLKTLPLEADRRLADELLEPLKELFRIWNAREEFADEAQFRAALVAQGHQLERAAAESLPRSKESRNLVRRLEKHADRYLRFTHVAGLEPTNNAAEQAIRHVVIDRLITQGTRAESGRTWCERIWTTIATCRQHSLDLLSFLERSLVSLLTDTPPPLLAPV